MIYGHKMFHTNKAGFEKISETAQCVNGNQFFFLQYSYMK